MTSRRLLSFALTLLTGAGALVALPFNASAAHAAVQPCTVTYTNGGGAIRPGPDPGKDHALSAFDIVVEDTRWVTDVDVAYDISHPDATQVTVHVLGPKTQPNLAPSIQTYNRGMASGVLNGSFRFDDEAGTSKIGGVNPAPGTYLPATPASGLEDHAANGYWSLWVLNYSPTAATLRSFSVTLTYATCDTDGDGIEDSVDNCPTVVNDQTNHDSDALGDACDLDLDGDRLANAVDGCPAVASSNPTGCPSAARKARLRYLKGKHRLQATITSPTAACAAGARVKLWRVRSKRDFKLLVGTASGSGRYRFKVPRGARYYVTVSPSYVSGTAECTKATSRKVRVPRRHRK